MPSFTAPTSSRRSTRYPAKNTASGFEALYSNTTGYYNTASGYEALRDNTTGHDNVASGVGALSDNVTGSYNVAVGSGATVGASLAMASAEA
mgnify:CR=1 FL=1